ncbi:uncharacterized protein LOC116059399 [Sander lucioperca]|uniref:uncharacterized protein LOC116059399 n=1 Tax=Sander lucioperca TaxID=283035 RepID=UPI00125E7F87|nr:uncharacterized protein LOC116059399 [Sander lucioperca]XP_031168299.1 uncharacterized protein LOC116059399 [Sander lucioperca]
MAVGRLFWVSCISFLLFDDSAGLPSMKGYGYPYKADLRNMGDAKEDEVETGQASDDQPTGPVYTSYNKLSVAQWPGLFPSRQNLPNRPSASAADKLVNGGSSHFVFENLKSRLFPLSPNQASNPAKPWPGPASTNRMPPSTAGGSSLYVSQTANYEPTLSASQAAKFPSFDSWKPQPDGSDYGVVDDSGFGSPNFNSGSSRGGVSNIPHLVYEEVFQYPSEYTGPSNTAGGYSQANYMSKGFSTGNAASLGGPSFPWNPTNVGAQMGLKGFWLPQKPVVGTQNAVVNRRVSQTILPPSSYRKSSNGYQTARYMPAFPNPMPVSSKGVQGQPAAPKDV